MAAFAAPEAGPSHGVGEIVLDLEPNSTEAVARLVENFNDNVTSQRERISELSEAREVLNTIPEQRVFDPALATVEDPTRQAALDTRALLDAEVEADAHAAKQEILVSEQEAEDKGLTLDELVAEKAEERDAAEERKEAAKRARDALGPGGPFAEVEDMDVDQEREEWADEEEGEGEDEEEEGEDAVRSESGVVVKIKKPKRAKARQQVNTTAALEPAQQPKPLDRETKAVRVSGLGADPKAEELVADVLATPQPSTTAELVQQRIGTERKPPPLQRVIAEMDAAIIKNDVLRERKQLRSAKRLRGQGSDLTRMINADEEDLSNDSDIGNWGSDVSDDSFSDDDADGVGEEVNIGIPQTHTVRVRQSNTVDDPWQSTPFSRSVKNRRKYMRYRDRLVTRLCSDDPRVLYDTKRRIERDKARQKRKATREEEEKSKSFTSIGRRNADDRRSARALRNIISEALGCGRARFNRNKDARRRTADELADIVRNEIAEKRRPMQLVDVITGEPLDSGRLVDMRLRVPENNMGPLLAQRKSGSASVVSPIIVDPSFPTIGVVTGGDVAFQALLSGTYAPAMYEESDSVPAEEAAQALYNYTEDDILFPDQDTNSKAERYLEVITRTGRSNDEIYRSRTSNRQNYLPDPSIGFLSGAGYSGNVANVIPGVKAEEGTSTTFGDVFRRRMLRDPSALQFYV